MALNLLVVLAIQIGTAILGRLLTGRKKRPKATPFEAPRVEEGATIVKAYGVQQVSGLVTLVSGVRTSQGTTDDDIPYTSYFAKMMLAICWGPIDFLFDIIFDEQALSLQQVNREQSCEGSEPYITSLPLPISHVGSTPAVFNIAARQMFGGNGEEGGVMGQVRFYWGMDDQPVDPLVSEQLETLASAYPNLCYAVFGAPIDSDTGSCADDDFYWSANVPTPKPVSFLVGCYPNALLNINEAGGGRVGGQDANYIEAAYDMLTNKVYGRGFSSDRFNLTNWQAAAQFYRDRGIGFSGSLTDQQTTEDFIDDLQSHGDFLIVTNSLTGLLEIKLLFPTYDIGDLVAVTEKNTRNFHQSGGTLAKTLNEVEVKYRKFIPNAVTVVSDELVTSLYTTTVKTPLFYTAQGRNLTNVVVWRIRSAVRTDLTLGTAYRFDPVDGTFYFPPFGGGELTNGDEIHMSYEASTAFAGFVDASEKDQNLANWQATGSSRSESYDYPWITSPALAKAKAIRLRKTVTRDLPVYKFDGNREFAHLTEGDCVKVPNAYGLTDEVIRLTKVGYGSLESPWLSLEGIRDIFAEEITSSVIHERPPGEQQPPPAPPAVTVTCLSGAIRIGLTAQDPTYSIEIWRADSDPGAGELTGADLVDTVPGSVTSYDDPQTVGVTKWYAARLVRAGFPDGPLSAWISCTAVGTDPNPPDCIEPTVIAVKSQTTDCGEVELVITDSQGRVLDPIEFQIMWNGVTEPRYTEPGRPPIADVPILPDQISTITYWVPYLKCDGSTGIFTDTIEFNGAITPEEPPPVDPDARGGIFQVVFHSEFAAAAEIPMDETPGDESLVEVSTIGRRRVDLSGSVKFRSLVQVLEPLQFNGELLWQFVDATNTAPIEDDWAMLDEQGTGAVSSLTSASAIPLSIVPVRLAVLARTDVVIRAVVRRSTGTLTRALRFASVVLEFQGGNSIPQPPESPPNPCDGDGGSSSVDVTDDFNYANEAALDAVWTIEFNTGDTVTRSLDLTNGRGGGKCLKLSRGINVHNGYGGEKRMHAVAPGDSITISVWMKGFDPVTWGGGGAFYPDGPVGILVVGYTTSNGPPVWGQFTYPIDDVTMASTYVQGIAAFTVPSNVNFLKVIVGWLGGSGSMDVSRDLFVDDYEFNGSSLIEPPPCDEEPPPNPEDPGGGSDDVDALPATGTRALILNGYRQSRWGDYPAFQGSFHREAQDNLIAFLDDCRAEGFRFILIPYSDAFVAPGDLFSQARYVQQVSPYGSLDLTTYHDVLEAIMVIDEPSRTDRWGPNGIQWAVVDLVLAATCKTAFPGYPRLVRYAATRMEQEGFRNPQFVTGSWNQWLASRDGDVLTWMQRQRAANTRLGLKNIAWSMNYDPSAAAPMSVTQITTVGIPMAKDSVSVMVGAWAPEGDGNLLLPGVQTAFATVRDAIVQP